MNHFTALKNLSPFTSLFNLILLFLLILSALHFTLFCHTYLQLTSLSFTFYLLSPSLS